MKDSLDFDGLQRLLWNFADHRVLTAAARTGLLRRLAEGAATTGEAAADLGLDPPACGKVIRALVALGVVQRQGDVFRIVADLEPLFRVGPEDLVPFIDHSVHMYEAWGAHLETWLRGGTWPRGERTPDQIRKFGEAMKAIGTQTAPRFLTAIDFDGVDAMLDVGGGHGHWAQVFCEARAGLRARVFDTPETAEAGRSRLEGSPLAERISFRGGDYIEDDLGEGFDLVLVANVLHQETAERAERLIRNCAEALSPLGRLAIVDFRIDDDRCGPALGALFAINMRNFGDTWTEYEIRSWTEAAGLSQTTRTDVGPDRWLIIASRP